MIKFLAFIWVELKELLANDVHYFSQPENNMSGVSGPNVLKTNEVIEPDENMPESQLRVAVKQKEFDIYHKSVGTPQEEYEAEALRLPLDETRGYEDIRQIKRVHAILDFAGTGKTILDCAGGSGYIASLLKNAGNDVTVMDVSQIQLNRAKWLRKIKTVFGRVEKLPFDDHSFDIVIMAEVLEHCESMSMPLSEAERVVKEEGQIILTFPIHESHDAYKEHLKQIRMTNIDDNMVVLSIKNILPHLAEFRAKNRSIKNS